MILQFLPLSDIVATDNPALYISDWFSVWHRVRTASTFSILCLIIGLPFLYDVNGKCSDFVDWEDRALRGLFNIVLIPLF